MSTSPDLHTRERRTPRTENDPDRYIRPVKGGRYQARPYDEGRRENLGTFPSKGEARRAIAEYWWGRFKPKLRFARPCRSLRGDWWIAVVRVPTRGHCDTRKRLRLHSEIPGQRWETVRVGGRYGSPEAAHKAAVEWLLAEVGPLPLQVMLAGGG